MNITSDIDDWADYDDDFGYYEDLLHAAWKAPKRFEDIDIDELEIEENYLRYRERIDIEIETEEYLDQIEYLWDKDSLLSEYDADEFYSPKRVSSRRTVTTEFKCSDALPREDYGSSGYRRRNDPNRSRHKNVRNRR